MREPLEWAAYLRRWQAAFPTALADDVRSALGVVPCQCSPKGYSYLQITDQNVCDRALTVAGEPISIPCRSYVEPVMRPTGARPGLTTTELTVLGCFYSRHHVGFARQYWVRQILACEEPFVVPFVVALLGEYIVEIVTIICQELPDLADPTSPTARRYGRFLVDNKDFHFLIRQRVASYWDCYFRSRYLYPEHCPTMILRSWLDRAARQEVLARRAASEQTRRGAGGAARLTG